MNIDIFIDIDIDIIIDIDIDIELDIQNKNKIDIVIDIEKKMSQKEIVPKKNVFIKNVGLKKKCIMKNIFVIKFFCPKKKYDNFVCHEKKCFKKKKKFHEKNVIKKSQKATTLKDSNCETTQTQTKIMTKLKN